MSILKVDTLKTTDSTNSIAMERVANGTAAAWVNFNGTGTVAIRASYNVSSITDNGTGDYTINFTNAMVDANYVLVLGYEQHNASTGNYTMGIRADAVGGSQTLYTTTQCRILYQSSGGTEYDIAIVNAVAFR